MLDTAEDLLAAMLTETVEYLDIPPAEYRSAVAQYEDIGGWLADYGETVDDATWDVYPQGSFRLGTVVRPLDRQNEYDIDLVCRCDIAKTSTTQQGLKTNIGKALVEYVNERRGRDGAPDGCDERKRCWTLAYARRFHLDVLPAIPDDEGGPTAILLTDRELRLWQHSDPIGYANWFRTRMSQELLAKRAALAKAREATVDQVPEWEVKTSLQRVVQVLKRHRDIHFATSSVNPPPSILVTTLAGHAYQGEQNLFAAVMAAAQAMPRFIERRDGRLWVPNPVQDHENFADGWHAHPERPAMFSRWLGQLERDLDEASRAEGLDRVATRLSAGFGDTPVKKALERLGQTARTYRETGRLHMAAGTAMLSTSTGITVPNRRGFYGETPGTA